MAHHQFRGTISGNIYTVHVKATGTPPDMTTMYSYFVTKPDRTNTSPTPQLTTPAVLIALLSADHAIAE